VLHAPGLGAGELRVRRALGPLRRLGRRALQLRQQLVGPLDRHRLAEVASPLGRLGLDLQPGPDDVDVTEAVLGVAHHGQAAGHRGARLVEAALAHRELSGQRVERLVPLGVARRARQPAPRLQVGAQGAVAALEGQLGTLVDEHQARRADRVAGHAVRQRGQRLVEAPEPVELLHRLQRHEGVV
jgi:hypothetical protein